MKKDSKPSKKKFFIREEGKEDKKQEENSHQNVIKWEREENLSVED